MTAVLPLSTSGLSTAAAGGGRHKRLSDEGSDEERGGEMPPPLKGTAGGINAAFSSAQVGTRWSTQADRGILVLSGGISRHRLPPAAGRLLQRTLKCSGAHQRGPVGSLL